MANCWSARDFEPAPFNDLQQRLNRKVARGQATWREYPAFVRVYDMLFDGAEDIRTLPWTERRQQLEAWFANNPQTRLDLSRGARVSPAGTSWPRCAGAAPPSTAMRASC